MDIKVTVHLLFMIEAFLLPAIYEVVDQILLFIIIIQNLDLSCIDV